MSEQQSNKPARDTRYLGKVKTIQTQYGEINKIYMDNLNHVNKDGSANTFYKGALVWMDVNGKQYQIKQMSFWTPKEGMKQSDLDRGYSCFITLNLNDEYEVTVLG